MTITIGILFGGASSEHEVSLASAAGVIAAIAGSALATTTTVALIGADRAGRWHRVSSIRELEQQTGAGDALPELSGIDVVLPILHGRFGEDGTVQGLLELAGIPYAGCGVLASALAMDKELTGRVLREAGIPTVPTVAIDAASRESAHSEATRIGYPVFVKPNRSGSSVGASLVASAEDLDTAVDRALAEDDRALIQPVDSGEEIDVGILKLADGTLVAGAPLRVGPGDGAFDAGFFDAGFFDYAAKYTAGAARFEVPARLPATTTTSLIDLAERSFRALGCDGLARIDFFVDANGAARVNEVNTLPGLSALSQFPVMLRSVGYDLPAVVEVLVARALAARPEPAMLARELHTPAPGIAVGAGDRDH